MFLPSYTTRDLAAIQKAAHVPLDMTGNSRSHSICIPVRVISEKGQIDAKALLDSGAKGVYINTTYVKKHQLPLQDLRRPIYP